MILIARPRPILQGSGRVIQGGGWSSSGRNCRSAYRGRLEPTFRFSDLDFRVILRKKTS